MKSTRKFVPLAWLIVVIEAVALWGFDYKEAVLGFWTAVACAIVITIVEWRRFLTRNKPVPPRPWSRPE